MISILHEVKVVRESTTRQEPWLSSAAAAVYLLSLSPKRSQLASLNMFKKS